MYVRTSSFEYINTDPYFSIEDIERIKLEITEEEIKDALQYPSYFGYSGDIKEMFKTWSLGSIYRSRDSTMMEESNADTLEEALEQSIHFYCEESGGWIGGLFDEEDYEITHCNHWAFGWVDHLSFRAINEDDTPTNIFAFMVLWNAMLGEYPVANDEDYSRRQWDYAYEYVESVVSSQLKDNVPETYICDILDEMSEHPNENWGYDDEILSIAKNLGFLEIDEPEDS